MNLEQKTNEELILIAQKGEQANQIFEIIFSRYNEPIKKYLISLGVKKEKVEDITQETFTKAFIKMNQYKPKGKFGAWLYTIAKNTQINEYRKNKKIVIKEENDFFELENSKKIYESSPEKEFIKKENYKELNSQIERLPNRYKQIIQYRYHKELSYKEISKELRISMSKVKTRLFRAHRLLKEKYKSYSKLL